MQTFNGPFVMPLAQEGTQLQANLAGEKARRYLVMDLRVEFDSYDEAYGQSRIVDPLYIAKLQDRLLTISSQKTADEVLERGTQEVFLEELIAAVEHFESSMRDPFHVRKIHVDVPNKTLQLDDGDEFVFAGTEENMVLRDSQGRTVYVDVTAVKSEFVGDIGVGVKGRVRNLYKVKFIIQ